MDIKGITIQKMLEEKSQFSVPNYQREFVWSENDAVDFFNDLNASSEEDPLFLGSFIFHKHADSKFYIVDGQQRITSMMIFLICLRTYVAEQSKFNKQSKLITAIQFMIQWPSADTPRLLPSPRIANAFHVMCDMSWDGKYAKGMGNRHGWNRINRSYSHFYSLIKNKSPSPEDVEQLLEKLSCAIITRIIVEEESKAITIFETVNARGAHLAIYDLIKAFLLSNASKFPDRDIEEEWVTIRRRVEESDFNLKRMLTQFLFSNVGYTVPKEIYRELQQIANDDFNQFVDDLKDFSKFFSFMSISPKKQDDFQGDFKEEIRDYFVNDRKLKGLDEPERIQKIAQSLYAIGLFKVIWACPLLYSSLRSLERGKGGKKEIDQWIGLVEFLEKFFFVVVRIAHSSLHGGALQNVYADHCRKFSNSEDSLKKIIDNLKSKLRGTVPISEGKFIESFIELSYSNNSDYPIIYYVFDKLNCLDRKGKPIAPANSSPLFSVERYTKNSHNIEHFMSRSKRGTLDDPETIDNIGNLLVIHRKDNGKLGNKSTKEKMEILKGWLGDRHISNKPYLERFVDQYESEAEKWDEIAIEKRARNIAKTIYEIMNYAS